jgi:hypothetical protein
MITQSHHRFTTHGSLHPVAALSSPWPRRAAWWAAAAAMVTGLPTLLYPPGRDQAVFLLAGRALAGGKIPYVEFWDIKPPGLFAAYLLPALVSPLLTGAAALLDLATLGIAMVLAARLGARLGRPAGGAAGGILLAGLWIFGSDWWDVGQGERLAAPLLIGALLLATGRTPRRWSAAGACIGGMVLLKYSLAPLALALLPFLPGGEEDGRRALRQRLTALLAGGALPLLVAGGALAVTGALPAWYEATVAFTGNYTRLAWERPGLLFRTLAVTGWAFVAGTWSLWLLAVAGTASGRGAGAIRRLQAGLWIAMATAAVSVIAQGKFFPYHWTIVWPPLALLAGLGAGSAGAYLAARTGAAASARLTDRQTGEPSEPSPLASGQGTATAWAVALALLAALAAALTFAPGWPGWSRSARRLAGSIPAAEQQAIFRVQGMGYDELSVVAEGIRQRSAPEAPVYLWGFEPAFYLAVDRPFPGRFPFSYPLVTPWAPARWREEFLSEFRRASPEWLVIRSRDPIPWVAGIRGDARERLRGFPELEAEIRRDYRVEPELATRHLQTLRRVAPSRPRN